MPNDDDPVAEWRRRVEEAEEVVALLAQSRAQHHYGTAERDQLLAASDEAAGLFAKLTGEMARTPWELSPTLAPRLEATLLAAMNGCAPCRHLVTMVRPCVVWLACHQAVCMECGPRAWSSPPPDEGDRCDLCGRRGVESFWPMALRAGTIVLYGDICRDCSGELTELASA